MRSIPSRIRRAASEPDRGAAIVEFALISILLVFLLFAVLQVAIYFYARNIVAASAADAARYASNSGVDDSAGATRAEQSIGQGLSFASARSITCTSRRDIDAASGLAVTRVHCHGHLRSVFAPLGGLVTLDASAASLKEGA